MRKIILSMLLLAGATTYAQVGINKEVPQATLDINAKEETTVSDKVEGLLIPRVSKEKAHKMGENTELQESTMIYVNDLSTSFSVPSATKARVEDITGNGYYFWNGTKWVRQTGKDGEEWIYNPTDQRIELKRSGKGDFHNYVYYDNTTGQYVNTDSFNIKRVDGTSVSLFDVTKAKKITFSLSNNIPLRVNSSGNQQRFLSTKLMNVPPEETEAQYFFNDQSSINLTSDNANNYKEFYSSIADVRMRGTGEVGYAVGNSGGVSIGNTQIVNGYVAGTRGDVSISDNATLNEIYGLLGRVAHRSEGAQVLRSSSIFLQNDTKNGDNTLIKEQIGVKNYVLNNSTNTNKGIAIAGISNRVIQSGQTKYPNMYGMYNEVTIDKSAAKPDNLYGIYISALEGALQGNYAIYSNSGKIRFGDLADGNAVAEKRLVIADKSGVLSTTTASIDDFVSLWANDDSNTRVYLKKTSAGVAREDSGSNRNSVTINDAGAITAKGFIGYNGASIFPDYVFEKYYKGYSDIKADYNFHNLTSVETFIKKNGHLPGYQSAQEIAKEGLIDIGATQLTNIEKIEELYLHTIEQEKKIEAKDAKIAELEARLERLEKLINK